MILITPLDLLNSPDLARWLNLGASIPCFFLCAWAQFRWYPAFLGLSPESFPSAHSRHCRKLAWLAPLPFLTDLLAAAWMVWLIWSFRSVFLLYDGAFRDPFYYAAMCAALTLIGWITTFLLIVPLHRRLEHGYDEGTVRTLIRLNAVRTAAWALKIPASLLFWRA